MNQNKQRGGTSDASKFRFLNIMCPNKSGELTA